MTDQQAMLISTSLDRVAGAIKILAQVAEQHVGLDSEDIAIGIRHGLFGASAQEDANIAEEAFNVRVKIEDSNG